MYFQPKLETMKTIFTLLTFVFTLNIASASEFEKELTFFNEITIAGNFEVYLVKGDKEHARIVNTDPELTDDQIEFVQKGSHLKITTKGNSLKKLGLKIYLTYKTVVEISTRNGGWLETQNALEGDKVSLHCTTDGVIHAKLKCTNVVSSISTGGTIRLSGTADIGEYKVSAGGFISAKEVVSKTVTAKISTGGDISCHATEKMDLKVLTAGTIKYIYDGEKGNYTEKISIGGTIKEFGK
jgi:Putative auto-transporter adhesin, head GIN domain